MKLRERSGKLTERQRRFVEEYLVDGSLTQAAMRAGYSRKTAYSIGQRLLKNVEVAAAVDAARRARSERTRVTADEVVAELDILRRSSVDDYEFNENGRLRVRDGVPAEAIRAVQSVRYRVKIFPQKEGPPIEVRESEYALWSKPATLKMLGEHTGIFEHKSAKGHSGVVLEFHGGPMGFERRSAQPTNARARGRGE